MFDAIEDMIINGVNLWSQETLENCETLLGNFENMFQGNNHWN